MQSKTVKVNTVRIVKSSHPSFGKLSQTSWQEEHMLEKSQTIITLILAH